MTKRLSKVFNDFHNECKRFLLPNWCYFTCLGILLWFVFLLALLSYSYTHYPSRLLEGVYDVTSKALLVIIESSFAAFIIGLLVPFLIAAISAIVMNRHITDESQNSVETPAYALQASPESESLSISIPSNFENSFKTWFTTRQGDLVRITGNKTLCSMMKEKISIIKNWKQTDLQRLGYLLYEIGAVENHGKNLDYKDWIPIWFEILGRTDAPAKPDSSKFLNKASNDVDFNDFKFLYEAAQKVSPKKERIIFKFEELAPPKTTEKH